MAGGLEPGVQAGERAGEAAGPVGHQAPAEARVGLEVLVAVDEQLRHLRREALDRPRGHRLAAQQLQALVHAAHAAALPAGEDQPGNGGHGEDFTVKLRPVTKPRFLVPFINLGHLLDHLVMLVFPTVVIALGREWDRSYAELLPLALGGFIAFGAFAIPAGWLADHWSRYKMMALFFFGIGASLFVTGFAQSGWQIALGLTLTGMFAAIYHPVGIAMLVAAPGRIGRALGWNGLWGNLGLAAAAIVSGALMDLFGWRAAFFVPGLAAVLAGVAFLALVPDPGPVEKKSKSIGLHIDGRAMARIFAILLVVTACGGIIFN